MPPEHQQEVFDRLTQTAFEQFVRRGEVGRRALATLKSCHGYSCHVVLPWLLLSCALYQLVCMALLDYTAQCSGRHCVLAEVMCSMCAPHEYSLTDLKCAAPPPPPPSPACQDLHQRAKRELSRQNTTVILAVCKVVREMRGLEQPYSSLLAELPSRNFNRYSVLVEKFEALVCSSFSPLT